jgi:hypothetical protein
MKAAFFVEFSACHFVIVVFSFPSPKNIPMMSRIRIGSGVIWMTPLSKAIRLFALRVLEPIERFPRAKILTAGK